MKRLIRHIVIHCADSPNGKQLGKGTSAASVIDTWHKARGFRRDDAWKAQFNPALWAIGYHWVIDVDGTVSTGRHPDEIPAQAQGHNHDSLGICLVGQDKFSAAQWAELKNLVIRLTLEYPRARVLGHRDFPGVAKTCPNFDVAAWIRQGMIAP